MTLEETADETVEEAEARMTRKKAEEEEQGRLGAEEGGGSEASDGLL